MIKNEAQRGWLAGILEGEGIFGVYKNYKQWIPKVVMATTDKDVLEQVQKLTGFGTVCGPYQYNKKAKPYYQWHAYNTGAIEIMLTVRDLMFGRRRAKVDEVLAFDFGREL